MGDEWSYPSYCYSGDYPMSFKIPFVPKSDVKQGFITTTVLSRLTQGYSWPAATICKMFLIIYPM